MKRSDLERRNRELAAELDRLRDALQTSTLRRLTAAYAWLILAEDPTKGRDYENHRTPRRDPNTPQPGASTRRWRSLRRRVDRQLHRSLNEIEAAMHGEWVERPKNVRRCSECGKSGRFGSLFCDRCGQELGGT